MRFGQLHLRVIVCLRGDVFPLSCSRTCRKKPLLAIQVKRMLVNRERNLVFTLSVSETDDTFTLIQLHCFIGTHVRANHIQELV